MARSKKDSWAFLFWSGGAYLVATGNPGLEGQGADFKSVFACSLGHPDFRLAVFDTRLVVTDSHGSKIGAPHSGTARADREERKAGDIFPF